MKITLGNTLPPYPAFIEGIRRAPDRSYMLTPAQTATALKNALRYIPLELHETTISVLISRCIPMSLLLMVKPDKFVRTGCNTF